MDNRNYTVYRHTSPSGKMYVGITGQSVETRWGEGRGYKHNEYFTRAIQKYGWNNIQHEILLEGLTKEEAGLAEKIFIGYWDLTNPNNGYNLKSGGFDDISYSISVTDKMSKSRKGRRHSEETKRKMSEAQRSEKNHMYGKYGELNPMYGRKHSEESKRRMSINSKGTTHTPEFKKKRSERYSGEGNPMYGKKHTPESIAKNSMNQPNRRMVEQINKETGEVIQVFNSIAEASRATTAFAPNIGACCRGLKRSAGGYAWRFVKGL